MTLLKHNKDNKILVVKYGSSSVSDANGLDRTKIFGYAGKLEKLMADYNIVIVSSGAVMAGKGIIGDDNLTDASIYSMVGSAALATAWQEAFMAYKINVGQILVTHNDIKDRDEGGRLRTVIKESLHKGIIPVINENDVLSDIELAKLVYGGDNDGLASKIAIAIGASELLLLTNVDGLLDENGAVVEVIDALNHDRVLTLINGKSDCGKGGMRSKIDAAVDATNAGVRVHIGNAATDYGLLISEKICTHVH